jgi:glycosyltransferase involved in cell wall biosynthesis
MRPFSNAILPGCLKPRAQYQATTVDLQRHNVLDAAWTLPSPPRISVVVPSLNQGRFLPACLNSLVSQDYPNLEIIVVDGGSTDGSQAVIRSFESELSSWVSEADTGQSNAINKGMAIATGEILCWLNADDCLMPGTLKSVALAFDRAPNVEAIYGHRILIDTTGKDIGKWILPYHSDAVLTYVDFIPQETLFWRASLWESIGAKLDESLDFALDWDLLCRFRDAGAKFLLLPKFLGQFRLHAEQKTQSKIGTGLAEMTLIRDRYASKQRDGLARFLLFRVYQACALSAFLSATLAKEALIKLGLVRIR